MGSGQSSVRATHFSRQSSDPPPVYEEPEEHHINISNRMPFLTLILSNAQVERLVEDATLAGGAVTTTPVKPKPRGDYKDKLYMEKIKSLDETHSERNKLTIEELSSMARRIELRTEKMVAVDPVCDECKQRVIQCYNEDERNIVKCWNTVGAFTACVRDAAAARLRARTQKDARELARRERHVKHAREHALKDLGVPTGQRT